MTTKGLISVIIPSRSEIFLIKTIEDILHKAHGPIEIIAVLDGEWPQKQVRDHWSTPSIIDDPRVKYLFRGAPRGMRDAINSAVEISSGEYLLKSDGHCMYADGFDEVLKKDIEDNWIVIPRRLRLDAEKWIIQEESAHKPPIDYEFLCSPADKGAKGSIWNERTLERRDQPQYNIDENMSFQGSCWFMTRRHWDFLGPMDEEGYGTFVREAQELGLKTWLSGGKIMTNKNTWYAHLHKGPIYGRGYYLDKLKMIAGEKYCDDYWFNNRYPKAIHDLAWLIERFMPVPTWNAELIERVRKHDL